VVTATRRIPRRSRARSRQADSARWAATASPCRSSCCGRSTPRCGHPAGEAQRRGRVGLLRGALMASPAPPSIGPATRTAVGGSYRPAATCCLSTRSTRKRLAASRLLPVDEPGNHGTACNKCRDDSRAVALNGPCRLGKTTLALAMADTRPSVYLDPPIRG